MQALMCFISKEERKSVNIKIPFGPYVPNQQIHGRRTLAKLVNKHKKDMEKNNHVTTKGSSNSS